MRGGVCYDGWMCAGDRWVAELSWSVNSASVWGERAVCFVCVCRCIMCMSAYLVCLSQHVAVVCLYGVQCVCVCMCVCVSPMSLSSSSCSNRNTQSVEQISCK